jgi:hypothetical protein
MAGYSGTPLPQKLGIKADHHVAMLGAPAGFDAVLGKLPDGVRTKRRLVMGQAFDVILFFVKHRSDLEARYAGIAAALTPAGGFWVAWPKQASGVATDLTENIIRAIGLEAGLVDNKVCAVDETWSGLRFVVRLKDRPR